MSDVSRVEEVFLAAVQEPDPARRATYLDAACGGDADFRRRVETLLAAQPQVGRFLEQRRELKWDGRGHFFASAAETSFRKVNHE